MSDISAELLAVLRAIIEEAPDEEPDPEDYDDTEAAFLQGCEVTHYEIAERLRPLVARL